MKKLIIIFVCVITIISGCSSTVDNNIVDQNNFEKELTLLREDYKRVNEDNESLLKENLELKKQYEIIKDSLETNQKVFVLDDNTFFDWIHNDTWDEINITEYYPDYDVENPEITRLSLSNFKMTRMRPDLFLYGIILYTEPVDPGSGGGYQYDFVLDSNTYSVQIYDSHCFKYDEKFYYCIGNLNDLSDAFFSEKKGLSKYNDYFEFLYDSSVFIGEKIYQEPSFNKSKIQLIAKEISKFNSIDLPNKASIGEPVEILTFYNLGDSSKVIIYDNYINIIMGENDTWLNSKDKSPLSILGAN